MLVKELATLIKLGNCVNLDDYPEVDFDELLEYFDVTEYGFQENEVNSRVAVYLNEDVSFMYKSILMEKGQVLTTKEVDGVTSSVLQSK